MRPSYITGVGCVLPGAIGAEALERRLVDGESAVARVERFETSRWDSHCGGVVTDFRPRDFIAVAKIRRMNELSRMAVAATRMALESAGAPAGTWGRGDVGVAMGTMFGPVRTSIEYMDAYVAHGPALAPPQLFAESVANAPGSHIAIENGFEGFNLTFTQRESSFLTALMHAAMQIGHGRCRAAIAGGVDELNEVVFEVLSRSAALATDEGSGEAMRPFDRRRNGLIAGEGALSIVLEADPRSTPLARISGFGIARDASATVSDWGRGSDAVARAALRAMQQSGLAPYQIDAVYASANGSVRGDAVEREALGVLFGEGVPPVSAVKALFGEYAAAGGVPIAAAAMAIARGTLHGSFGYGEPDEGAPFEPVRSTRPAAPGHVLALSISAGGGIVAAILSKP